jgi:hypothetical protein
MLEKTSNLKIKKMEFQIRQGATEPILKLRMIQDGKNDKSSFNDDLENAIITFEMIDTKTGQYEVIGETCDLSLRTKLYNQTTDEYYIIYKFKEIHTQNVGKYEGKVTVIFRDTNLNPTSKLILPIKEKLYINIF